ncbi:MAG TPA: hypothetical protein VMN58_09800 [Acidimicrobiales bacterium]|nr:hypothetical protein [Acidimicrobiales bacterium]
MDDPELIELLDEEHAADRGAARDRERALRHVAEDGASLGGALLDLAEQGTPVTVRTRSGRTHHGSLVGVGDDFCVLQAARGSLTYLATDTVTTVRPQPGERHPVATGDRKAPRDLRLVELLASALAERPRLALVLSGGEVVAGELRAVGTDVVTLRLDGDPRALCYVSAGNIAEATVGG